MDVTSWDSFQFTDSLQGLPMLEPKQSQQIKIKYYIPPLDKISSEYHKW